MKQGFFDPTRWEYPFPRWLIITFVCLFVFFQSAVQSGFLPSTISVLQDSFALTSKQTGTIVSMYDISTLFAVTHVGHFCSGLAPRFLGLGMGLMGVSILMFALVVFLPVTLTLSASAFWLLIISQVVFGISASPLYIVSPVYFAANLDRRTLSLSLGFFYAVSALGPAAGFIFGGLAIDNWTWWGCFLLVASLTILLSIPLFFCPLYFKKDGEEELGSETSVATIHTTPTIEPNDEPHIPVRHGSMESTSSHTISSPSIEMSSLTSDSRELVQDNSNRLKKWYFKIKEGPFWKSLINTLKEPTFIAATLGLASQTLCVSAMTVFFPLFMTVAFDLSEGLAAILVGAAVVPGVAGGIVLGGYLMKRLDAKILTHIRLTYICTIIAIPLAPIFFLSNLPAFLVLLVFLMALVFMGTVSITTITMSVVDQQDRGVAMGLQSVIARALGAIPGPIIMGELFDRACIEWDGSCQKYDPKALRLSWFAFAMGIVVLTAVFFILQEVTWRWRLKRIKPITITI